MCGIAGVINFKQQQNPKLAPLLANLQARGKDATGIAHYDTAIENWHTLKAGIPANAFLDLPVTKQHLTMAKHARIVLLHCRQATHGSARDDSNNHPIIRRNGLLIHNGVAWFKKSYEANGQTDSEQILAHIENFGILKGVTKGMGSLTIAYVSFTTPDVVWLYRWGTPLVTIKNGNRLWFCSELNILTDSIPNISGKLHVFEDGELWRVDSKTGKIRRYKANAKDYITYTSYTRPVYRPVGYGQAAKTKALDTWPYDRDYFMDTEDAGEQEDELLGIHPLYGNLGRWPVA